MTTLFSLQLITDVVPLQILFGFRVFIGIPTFTLFPKKVGKVQIKLIIIGEDLGFGGIILTNPWKYARTKQDLNGFFRVSNEVDFFNECPMGLLFLEIKEELV
jgi:hypothetical protein